MKKYLYLTLPTVLFFCFLFYLNYDAPSDEVVVTSEKEAKKNTRKKDRPDLAAAQEIEMTKSPILGYPPTYRKIQAFEETKRLLQRKNNTKAIANVKWTERGPNNVGGRTRSIFFDPNDPSGKKVWAGAVAGGIWYNNDITDASSQWQNVDDFMANIAISTMAYDPQNTNVFYAGTGLLFSGDVRGGGIWKSEDGGTTWNHLSSTLTDNDNEDFLYIQKIVVTSSSKVIAGTTSGILISTDGGNSWTRTLDVTITDIDLASDGTLYASNSSGDIYKSTDNGDSWGIILSQSGRRVELASAPSDPLVLYAVSESTNQTDVGYFKKTVDGGDNWSDMVIPKYYESGGNGCSESSKDFTRGQAFFDLILGVYPNDPNALIVGGIDLHRSTDGGTTWQPLSYWTGACADYVHADQHAITFKEGSGTTALFGNDGGVFYSETLDADVPEFEERANGYNTTLFYSCGATNEAISNVYVAGSQDNGSQKFTTHGVNSTVEVTGGDGAYTFIDQNDPNIMISSYVYNSYYRSLDGGVSFESFGDGQNSGRFINPADYDDDAKILYAAHNDNSLAVYSNISGQSIGTEIKNVSINGKISHLHVSPYKENRIFIGTGSGAIFMIDNANTTPQVTNLDNGQLSGGYVSSIEIGSYDDHLLVTFANYDVISVWETKDGGTTWKNKEGNLPDMPIRWSLYNPANRNEVLLATEFGIWSTDDISAEQPVWGPSVEGLANVKCMMLQYRESDQQVIVATFGRGLFTSNIFTEKIYPDFSVDANVAYMGTVLQFKNHSVGQINDYLWDFGDGTTSTEEEPSHTYSSPGSYTVTLSTNSSKEQLIKNDIIYILPDRDGDYSLSEGGNFDAFTSDFYPLNIAGTPFELGSSAIEGKNETTSGANAWVTGLTESQYTDNSTAYLYTPHFDLSAAGTYELSFSTKHKFEETWDGFIVEYTLDSGKTWSKLRDEQADGWYNQTSHPQSVFGVSVPIFSGSTSGYEAKTADISSLSGKGRVGFRFLFRSDAASTDVGMALDDFEISGNATDAIPDFTATPIAGTACENTSIVFEDKSLGATSAYSWDFGAGASPATAQGRGPHSVTYATAGLKTVSLTVEGETNGTQTETKADYITIVTNSIQEKTLTAASTEVCSGEGTSISVEGSESGYTYQLFNAENNIPIGGWIEGNDGTLILPTGNLSETTSFYVKVSDINSSCSLQLSSQVEVLIAAPVYKEITIADNEVCDGYFLTLTIESSEEGVNYSLYNLTTAEVFSDNFTGNGGTLEITSYPVTSTVEVQAVAESGTCSFTYEPFKAFVKEAPSISSSFSTDQICIGNNFIINVSNSVPELAYSLYDVTTGEAFSDEFTGNGGNLEISSYPVANDVDVQVVATSASCKSTDEVFTIFATTAPEPVITADGATLICSETTGNIAWYLNGTPINESGTTIQARSYGEYTVEVTLNGCTGVSEPFLATILGVEDLLKSGELKVYPNPTSGLIHVNQSGKFNRLRIYDLTGQVIMARDAIFQNELLNLQTLQAGQYILELSGKTETIKLNIQKLH